MTEKRASISGRLKLLFILLVPLAVLYTLASIWGARNIREKSARYTEALADLYVKDIDERIININRKLGLLFLGEGDVEQDVTVYIDAIKDTKNQAYRNYYTGCLKNIFDTYALEYGDRYHFFVYFQKQGEYIGNQNGSIPNGRLREYENGIGRFFQEYQMSQSLGSQYWSILPITQDMSCIIKFFRIQDHYIGCWIRPEDLILPLSEVMSEGGGSVLLFDEENRLYVSLNNGEYRHHPDSSYTNTVIEKRFASLPFRLRLVVASHGMFKAMFTAQMLMIVLSLIMLALICGSVLYLYRKILIPVRKFSDNLEMINKGGGQLEEISTGELLELKRANQEFAELFKKINNLENEIQLKELEKQSIYLDYLKLQIRPHFYLNCLNFIYNMIDLKKEKLASRMTWVTADYMRYLLKSGPGFVYIREELEHIENYMEIQKLRFEGAVDYYTDQEETVMDSRIPHMLIQPFVENSIKYAADLSHKVLLTITLYSEDGAGIPYINICISDTGPGFPEEVLKKLNGPAPDAQSTGLGIGIMNTIKRLKHYYGNRYSITFSNGPGKGAIVDIHIPKNLEVIGLREEGFL